MLPVLARFLSLDFTPVTKSMQYSYWNRYTPFLFLSPIYYRNAWLERYQMKKEKQRLLQLGKEVKEFPKKLQVLWSMPWTSFYMK